jgi:hypothetical protein
MTVRPPEPESLQADLRVLCVMWLGTSVDSYTMKTFQKEGSLIHINRHSASCCQAHVLPIGQLASTEEDDAVRAEVETAASGPAAMVRDDSMCDIFSLNAEPPTEMSMTETPLCLVPLLHRWFHLHDLEATALKYCPIFFPVQSPLMSGAVLTMSRTEMKCRLTLTGRSGLTR